MRLQAAWPPRGRLNWSLRDSVNYGESATLAALAWAADHRRELLLAVWQRGARALERSRDEPPFAWVFPARQADPVRLAVLMRRLLAAGVEVHRLSGDFAVGAGAGGGNAGGTGAAGSASAGGVAKSGGMGARPLPAGTWVVRLDQPLRGAALGYLAGTAEPPWPWLDGVVGEAVADRGILGAPMERVTSVAMPAGGVAAVRGVGGVGGAVGDGIGGAGSVAGGAGAAAGTAAGDEVYLLRDSGQTSLLAARVALGSYQIDAAEVGFKAGGIAYPAGSWIVQAPRAQVAAVGARLGLVFAAAPEIPDVARHVVHLPRLAVLHGWTGAEASGWVRFALDRERVSYALIGDQDLRQGDLGERFDVILTADSGSGDEWQRRQRGLDRRWSPLAYSRSPELPALGQPDGAADITGGLDDAALTALRQFVEHGGVLVTLGNASALAAGTGLAVGLGVLPAPAPAAPLAASVAARGEGAADGARGTVGDGPGAADGAPGAVGGGPGAAGSGSGAAGSGLGAAGSGPGAEAGAAVAPGGSPAAPGDGATTTGGATATTAEVPGTIVGGTEGTEEVHAAVGAGPGEGTPGSGPAGAGAREGTPLPGAATGSSAAAAVPSGGDAGRPGMAPAGICPGGDVNGAAILRAAVARREHPAVYGYPAVTQVLRRGGPLLAAGPRVQSQVVLRFAAPAGVAAAGAPTGTAGSVPTPTAVGAMPPAGGGRGAGVEVEEIDGPRHPASPAPKAAGASGAGDADDGTDAIDAIEAIDAIGATDAVDGHASATNPLPRPLGPQGGLVLAGCLPAGVAAALSGAPALVDLPFGRGHLVAFAFDPFDPTLELGDLRLVYNVLLNWHALAP